MGYIPLQPELPPRLVRQANVKSVAPIRVGVDFADTHGDATAQRLCRLHQKIW